MVSRKKIMSSENYKNKKKLRTKKEENWNKKPESLIGTIHIECTDFREKLNLAFDIDRYSNVWLFYYSVICACSIFLKKLGLKCT